MQILPGLDRYEPFVATVSVVEELLHMLQQTGGERRANFIVSTVLFSLTGSKSHFVSTCILSDVHAGGCLKATTR